MFALVCPCTIPDQAIFGLIVSPFEHLPTLDPPSFGGWNMSKNLSKMAPKWVVLGPFFLIFRVLGRSWGLLGVLGGSRWVWGGLLGVLAPSWARLGLVLGGPGGVAGGSFSALWEVLFGCRFRDPVGRRLGTDLSLILRPKSAPKRPREGHRNQLRNVMAKMLIFDNPPTFLADFCCQFGLQNAPEWSKNWLPKGCRKEDGNKTRK